MIFFGVKMSYSKLNAEQNKSLIDQDDDLIQHNNMTTQPYIVADIEADTPTTNGNDNGGAQRVAQPKLPENATNSHIFQINYYRQFFDLDTDTFVHKLKRAMNPLDKTFTVEEEGGANTELYGFIWVTGTLIFLMFVSSTGSNIISSWIHGGLNFDDDGNLAPAPQYEYKFDLLRLSVFLFYGYNILVPALLFVITTWIIKFPHRLPLTEIISIYGYTNVLWIPITLANFIIAVVVSNEKHGLLLNSIEWVIVILSGIVTGASNLMKISPIIEKNCLILQEGNPEINGKRQHLILIGLLAGFHLIFTFLVKICFFKIE